MKFLPNSHPALTALILTLTCTLRVAAQDSPPAKSDTTLPTVQISGSQDKYDPRRYDTAAKTVVTEEEILKHGDTTLADVLKRQAGITVNGGNAGRGGGEIRMRGLGSGYTQILLNGEPAPPGFTLDDIAPALIERIEIMRAATAEFSTQAIAGTINIVLKRKTTAAKRELKFNAEGSNRFKSASLNGLLSDKLGGLSYSLAGNLRRGNYQETSTQTQEGSDANGQATQLNRGTEHNEGRFAGLSLTPRINWSLANGDTLTSQTVLNLNGSNNAGATAWVNELGAAAPYPLDRTQYRGRFGMARTDLNWVRNFADGAKLDAKFGLNASRRAWDHFEQAYDSAGQQTLNRMTPGTARDQGLTLVGKYATPVVQDHTLAMGWDAGSTQRRETRDEHDLPLAGPGALGSDQSFDATLNRLALFAQDEWSITPQWSVYLGLRWETLDTRSQGNTFDAIHNRSQVLSPLFQTLWKLPGSDKDQLRLALTRTYKAPGIGRLIPRPYTVSNNSAVSPDYQGNPGLRPELATGIDLAYEHFFGEGAVFSASVYRRQIDDFTRSNTSLLGQRWVSMPVNDGQAQTRGLELDAKLPLKVVWGEAAPDMDVRANLAFNASSVTSVPGPNNRMAEQTPLSANLGLDYKLKTGFSTGANYTFKRGGPVQISATSSTYVSPRRELDVYALWKLNPQYQLRVSAANVLAQPYTAVAQYTDSNGGLCNTSVNAYSAVLRATLELKL